MGIGRQRGFPPNLQSQGQDGMAMTRYSSPTFRRSNHRSTAAPGGRHRQKPGHPGITMAGANTASSMCRAAGAASPTSPADTDDQPTAITRRPTANKKAIDSVLIAG